MNESARAYFRNRLILRKQQGLFTAGVLISLGLCFMLFLFAPMEIYLNNQSDFWYDYAFLLPYCLLIFAVAFVTSLLIFEILWFCGDRVYDLGLAGGLVLFVGCYFQGNFQADTLPLLDGAELDMREYTSDIRLSCAVWIVVIFVALLFCFLLKRDHFRSVVKIVGGFAFGVLFVTIIALFITTNGYQRTDYLTCTQKGLFEMSEDQNFVIFILDAVDAGTLEKVAQNHPEYRESLKDFTYYSNTMSGYPSTNCAVPLILSGEWFVHQEPYQLFVEHAFSKSRLFEFMKKQGYELSLYDEDVLLPDSIINGLFKNMLHTNVQLTEPVLFVKRQLKMVGFKYAPWVLKHYCFFDAHRIWNQRHVDEETNVFVWEDNIFYKNMQEVPITYNERKQFKIIHLEGAHIPFIYDAQLNTVPWTDYDTQVEASMTLTMAYLDKLREAGVYDNSVIMIMSDHGLGEDIVSMDGRQHPILFIKGFGEKHELQYNDAPVCQEDFMDAYEKLAAGNVSAEVFHWKEGDIRERRYMYYSEWTAMEHMTEYIQKGHARDEDAMEPTGIVYDQ